MFHPDFNYPFQVISIIVYLYPKTTRVSLFALGMVISITAQNSRNILFFYMTFVSVEKIVFMEINFVLISITNPNFNQ